MVDQAASDMVMTFQLKKGDFLAECQLDVDPQDPLMKADFRAATDAKAGNYFEITGFEFGLKIVEDDTSKKKVTEIGSAVPTVKPTDMTIKPFDENKMMTVGGFAKWRSASDDDIKGGNIPIKLEVDTFSFTRYIDRASPGFFEACLNSESFASATLVKRVSVDGNNVAQGFLQMKFTDVLITGVDWSDGLLVTEKCEFICRGFEMHYRPQNDDGSLQGAVSAEWGVKTHALRAQKG